MPPTQRQISQCRHCHLGRRKSDAWKDLEEVVGSFNWLPEENLAGCQNWHLSGLLDNKKEVELVHFCL